MSKLISDISTNETKNKTHKKMSYKSKLNAIRVVLGLNVKLASEKLVDGTMVEAEEFAPGFDIFVVAEDGTSVPAPDGEHITESGLKVKTEGGKIVSIDKAEDESPKIEVEVEQAAEEVPAEEKKEVSIDKKIEEVMEKVVMAMEPIIKDVAEMKSKIAKMEEKFEKFSKQPAAGKISTYSSETKEEINEVDARVNRLNELLKFTK